MKILAFFAAVSAALLTLPGHTYSANEFDAGVGFSPWDSAYRSDRNKREQPGDPFIKLIAARFGHDEAELMKLWHKGYGRNELIKLLVISAKSGVPFKEIVRSRDKNVKLSKICEINRINYKDVLKEAAAARKDLDSKTAFMGIYNTGTIVKTSSGTLTVFYSTFTATPLVESTGTVKTPK